jgi:integrase
MSIRLASHLYRNRHGTFYFRLTVPKEHREQVCRYEVRFSLGTEQRSQAIITALHLKADLPRLMADIKRMADSNEQPPPDYFALWQRQLLKSAELSAKLGILRGELQDREYEISGMVTRATARGVVKQAYTTGQLKGKNELEQRLSFPWQPERTKLFSELVAAYLNSFSHRAKGGTRKPPGAKTLDGYTTDLKMFVTIMGDVRIGAIDRDVAGAYFNILRQLPANMNRIAKYRDKSITELLAMKAPPQSETNASKRLERASGMFKWALDEKRKWGIDANPFTGFGQSGDAASPRRPFTHNELLALLNHPDFTKKQFKSAYSFWLIPLAVFTGARLGELCQLDLKDFVEIDGIPCIDINDTEATEVVEGEAGRKKRVKTKNAKRLVPIHPELIRLGILRYVEAKRQEKQVYLFPELSRARRDGPSHAASNWFQRFRKSVGIATKQETVFHSFRHGFITNLLDGGIAPHTVAPVVGHEAELITGRVYWNQKDATKRKPTVDAFSVGEDVLTLFPTVEQVTFVKPAGPQPGRNRSKNASLRP